MTDSYSDAELLRLGSATLYEASKQDLYLDAVFRPVWPGAEVVGRAVPVHVAIGDNLALHHAIAAAGAGTVIVADAGSGAYGYWGEVMTVAAQARGIRGLVIDGGVRDTNHLARLAFPVFSTNVAIRGTVKRWPGILGAPVTLRGHVVCDGDLVVGDADGIAVIPSSIVDDIVTAARERASKEESFMAELRNGRTTLDLYNLRKLGDPLRF